MFRFGLLGCGHIAKRYGKLLGQPDSPFSLEAVTDISVERGELFSKMYNVAFDENVERFFKRQLDIICVCTPNALHAQHAIDALKANSNVLLEHPLATNYADGRKVLDVADTTGKRVFIVRQRRFLHSVQLLKTVISTGIFGQPKFVEAELLWNRRPEYFSSVAWRTDPQNGGVILNQASHFLDLLIYLFGQPKGCFGVIGNVRHKIPVEDSAIATLSFTRGPNANIFMSTASPEGQNTAHLTVVFSDRVITLTGKEWQNIEGLSAEEIEQLTKILEGPLSGDHYGYLKRVCMALSGDDIEVVGGNEGLKTTCLIDLIYKSFSRDNHSLGDIFGSLFDRYAA